MIVHAVMAGLATFLVGGNLALVYRYWPEPWLIGKLASVSALLTFVAATQIRLIVWERPVYWTAWFGIASLVIEVAAGAILHLHLYRARTGSGTLVAYRRR